MKRTLIAFLLALPLLGITCSNRPALPRSPLRIQLETYSRNGELWVTMHLTNRSAAPVYLNKIDIEMSPRLLNHLFVIRQNQQNVAYLGALAKRLPLSATDFVLLKPQQTVRTKIRLDKTYAFKPGRHRYSIRYQQFHSSPVDSTLLTEFTSAVHRFTYTFSYRKASTV